MPLPVSDFRSNVNDQLAHAATTIGKGLKRRVFEAIYRGRADVKTVDQLCEATRLSRKQVLTAGLALARTGLVEQTLRDGQIAYQKDHNFSHYRDRILALADDEVRLSRLPTKVNPRVVGSVEIAVSLTRELVNVRQVSVDDIASLSAVRAVPLGQPYTPMPEVAFKTGVQRIVGEPGTFKDWPGEKNDLFTTTLSLEDRRLPTAVAFKGRGKKGVLTPSGMGVNGDQIGRLFETPAELFIVQYWGQVHERVYSEMKTHAVALSIRERGATQINFGVIDGSDSTRLLLAYPEAFKTEDVEEES